MAKQLSCGQALRLVSLSLLCLCDLGVDAGQPGGGLALACHGDGELLLGLLLTLLAQRSDPFEAEAFTVHVLSDRQPPGLS